MALSTILLEITENCNTICVVLHLKPSLVPRPHYRYINATLVSYRVIYMQYLRIDYHP